MKGRVVVIKEYMKPMEIEEYDVPDPEPGAIVLKMKQAGICGSDLHHWRGEMDFINIPPAGRLTGHEGNGVVYKLGKGVTTDALGKPIKEGDRVMHTAIKPCNHCYQCLNGHQNWCASRSGYGGAGEWPYFTGTYGDYYYVGANQPVFAVTDELPDSMLGWVNCAMGTVTEGLLQAGLKEGQYVVIQGAGGLGLNATAVARDMGAHRVIVLDRLANRLQLAEEFGADQTINIEEFNTPETRRQRVLELTGGRGADIVMELVGRSELFLEGVSFLTNGGTFIEIGNIVRGRPVSFDPSTILFGKKIMGSLMYRPSLLPMMMESLVKNQDRVPYHKIVSNTYPLADVNKAMAEAEWADRQTAVTRAMLVP